MHPSVPSPLHRPYVHGWNTAITLCTRSMSKRSRRKAQQRKLGASEAEAAAAAESTAAAASAAAGPLTPTGSSGLSKAAKRNAQKKRAAKLKHAAKPESGEKPKPRAAKPSGASLPLAVVFEDDEVLAINKPAGLLCHPSPGFWDRGTVVHALPTRQRLPGFSPLSPEMLGERRSNTGEADSVIPRAIVHRLDRGTTGLMGLAKTARHLQVLPRG